MAISKNVLGGDRAPYFKPADHLDDALILEPKSVRTGVMTSFVDPKTKEPIVRDEVVARVTAFKNLTSLEEGRAYFNQAATLTNGKLVKDLIHVLEQAKKDGDDSPAVFAKLKQWQPKGGGNKVWVLEEITSGETFDGLLAFYDDREAAVAKAIDEAPDFD